MFFLTGTDEHGQKVEQAAAAAGVDPTIVYRQDIRRFRDMSVKMGVSFDDWIRTTTASHVSCTELWKRIEAAGDIYLGHYEGWYAVRDEAFYDEDELTTRPDGTNRTEWRPGRVGEGAFVFLRLSAWQDTLLKLYEEQPDFILPPGGATRSWSFVRGGLRDHPSAGPRSPGASRCRVRPTT